MSEIIIKEEFLQDEIDIEEPMKYESMEENLAHNEEKNVEENVKDEKEPGPRLGHDISSIFIKQEVPEEPEHSIAGEITPNMTPNREGLSPVIEINEVEPFMETSVRTSTGSQKKDVHPVFYSNVQKPSEIQAVLYSIKRLTSYKAPTLTDQIHTPSHKWRSFDWVPQRLNEDDAREDNPKGQQEPVCDVPPRNHEPRGLYNEKFAKLRLRYLKWLESESASHREERLKKMRDRGKSRRVSESDEERENRLKKLRMKQAQRLANETPEQKAHRLQQMRLTAAQRLASETPEQREMRLSKMRETAARRLANESPEKREHRLSQLRSYRSRRIAKMQQIDLQNVSFPQLTNGNQKEQDSELSLQLSHELCQNATREVTSFSQCSVQFQNPENEASVENQRPVNISDSDQAQELENET